MARLRLGVALLVPPPIRAEVDGLRRAVGDPALDRVPAHLTLVPPVNVRQEALPAALATVRRAAAATPRRLTLTLGPPATFLPDAPVLYLGVGGDLEALHALLDRVFTGPLERSLTWPFVPHVTLTDQATPERIQAGLVALAEYRAAVAVEAIHLLQETGHGAAQGWAAIADAAFGPAAVVGRGGLELELDRSSVLDPVAAALVAAEAGRARDGAADGDGEGAAGPAAGDGVGGPGARTGRPPIVITARREGVVVGVAGAWLTDDGGRIAVLVGASHRRQGIGGHLLAAVESAVAEAAWACRQLAAEGPAAFYRARSRWSVPGYSKTMDE